MPDAPEPPTVGLQSTDGEPSAEPRVDRSAAPTGEAATPFTTLLARALRLRCPVCGQGKMFRGLLSMNEKCSHCGLYYERASGYFLGSIYFNYTVTAVIASVVYLVPMIVTGRPPQWLLLPIVVFCVLFPLFFFRYARSLWLALDHYLSPLNVAERPRHDD